MQPGNYLFTNVGFRPKGGAFLSLQDNQGTRHVLSLDDQTCTLAFEKAQRYCRGWHNLETGEDFACPQSQAIIKNYDQCAICQKRTGFNPAFYHASTVSPQQERRNAEPHFLYIAHFAPGVLKVGISYAARGLSRLLEQGARSAVILDTFKNAYVAREHEAEIAKLQHIAETIQLRKKIGLLKVAYPNEAAKKELQEAVQEIETSLEKTFNAPRYLFLDQYYFPKTIPPLSQLYDLSQHNTVSGKVLGMIGSCLVCEQQDTPVYLPLKQYIGYRVTYSTLTQHLELAERQLTLF